MNKFLKYIKKILLLVKYSEKEMQVQTQKNISTYKNKIKKVLLYVAITLYSIFIFANVIREALKQDTSITIINNSINIFIFGTSFMILTRTFYLEYLKNNNYDKVFPVTQIQRGFAEIFKNLKLLGISTLILILYYIILYFNDINSIQYILRGIFSAIILVLPICILAMIIPKIIIEILKKIFSIKLLKKLSIIITTGISIMFILLFSNNIILEKISKSGFMIKLNEQLGTVFKFIISPNIEILNIVLISIICTITFTLIYVYLEVLSKKYEELALTTIIYNFIDGIKNKNSKNDKDKDNENKELSENKKIEKKLKNSLYKLSNNKRKAYYNYDKKFYLKTPMVFLNVVIPIMIIPLVLLANFWFGFQSGVNGAVNELKNTKLDNNQTIYEKFEQEGWLHDYENQIKYKQEPNFDKVHFIKQQTQEVQNKIKEYENLQTTNYYVHQVFKTGLLQEIKDMIINNNIHIYAILGIISASIVFNLIGGIAISKDKEDIVMLKKLPFSISQQLRTKTKFARNLAVIPYIVYITILMLLLADISILFTPIIIVTIIFGLIFITNTIYEQLLIDLLFPNLSWKNPVELVKRNFKMFIIQILQMLKIALYAYLIFKFKDNLNTIIYILFVFNIIIYVFVQTYMSKYAKQRYIDI